MGVTTSNNAGAITQTGTTVSLNYNGGVPAVVINVNFIDLRAPTKGSGLIVSDDGTSIQLDVANPWLFDRGGNIFAPWDDSTPFIGSTGNIYTPGSLGANGNISSAGGFIGKILDNNNQTRFDPANGNVNAPRFIGSDADGNPIPVSLTCEGTDDSWKFGQNYVKDVNGNQVLTVRQADIANTAGATLAQLEATVNALKAMMRVHGFMHP